MKESTEARDSLVGFREAGDLKAAGFLCTGRTVDPKHSLRSWGQLSRERQDDVQGCTSVTGGRTPEVTAAS